MTSPARADETPADTLLPIEGGSWIVLRGGVRLIPQLDVSSALNGYGETLRWHDSVQPAAELSFAYRFLADWALATEFDFSPDRYGLGDGSTVAVQTYALLIAIDWMPFRGTRWEPFLEGGLGYYLSGVTQPSVPGTVATSEADGSGAFLGVGLRVALTKKVGLEVEERYALAFADLGMLGLASVGGDTVAIGLYGSF